MVSDQFEAGLQDVLGLMVQGHGSGGEVVEQGFHALVEQGDPVLHAGVAAAFGDGEVDRVGGGGGAEELAPGGAEACDGVAVERDFGDGAELDAVDLGAAALGGGVEAAEAFDGVAEEVDADGFGEACGVEIDDAAADGVFAGFHDGGGAAIAMGVEEQSEAVGFAGGVGFQRHGGGVEHMARRDVLDEGVHRGEDDHAAVLLLGEAGEGGDAFGDDGGVGGDTVVGQAVPGGEAQDFGVGVEEGEGFGEARHSCVVAGDVEDGALVFAGAGGDQMGVPAIRRAVDGCGHCPAASFMARSIGLSASGGMGRRPVSQSARSTSGSSMISSSASISASVMVWMRFSTKPPMRRSVSWVPRWVARNSRRRLLVSEGEGEDIMGAI